MTAFEAVGHLEETFGAVLFGRLGPPRLWGSDEGGAVAVRRVDTMRAVMWAEFRCPREDSKFDSEFPNHVLTRWDS